MSYTHFEQLQPSSGIEAVVCARFTSPDSKNLITAASNRIVVYEIDETTNGLEYMLEEELFGTIVDIKSFAVAGRATEMLAVCLSPATLRILEFDRLTQSVVLACSFNMEPILGMESFTRGRVEFDEFPILKISSHIDNNMSFLGMVFFDTKFLLLSIKTEGKGESIFMDLGSKGRSQFSSGSNSHEYASSDVENDVEMFPYDQDDASTVRRAGEEEVVHEFDSEGIYRIMNMKGSRNLVHPSEEAVRDCFTDAIVLDLPTRGILHVRDFDFTGGIRSLDDAVLAFLHEPKRTSATRIKIKSDTLKLSMLHYDGNLVELFKLREISPLPYDIQKIYPALRPSFSMLLVGANNIVHVSEERTFTKALNAFARETSIDVTNDSEEAENDENKVEEKAKDALDAPNISLDKPKLICIEPDLYLVTGSSGIVYAIHINCDELSAYDIVVRKATAMAPATALCRISNRLFFVGSRLASSLLIKINLKTQLRAPEEEATVNSVMMDVDGDDSTNMTSIGDIFPQHETFEQKLQRKVALRAKAALNNISPLQSFCVVKKSGHPSGVMFRIIGCCGSERTGTIFSLEKSIEFVQAGQVHLSEYEPLNLWSTFGVAGYTSRLVISSHDDTKVFQVGDNVSEITNNCAYVTDDATIHTKSRFCGGYVLQICKRGAYLLERDIMVSSIPFSGEEQADSAMLSDSCALVRFKSGKIVMLKVVNGMLENDSLKEKLLEDYWSMSLSEYEDEDTGETVYKLYAARAESGDVDIFTLPELEIEYTLKDLANGDDLIYFEDFGVERGIFAAEGEEKTCVVELFVVSNRIIIASTTMGDLLVYRVFKTTSGSSNGQKQAQSKLRAKRQRLEGFPPLRLSQGKGSISFSYFPHFKTTSGDEEVILVHTPATDPTLMIVVKKYACWLHRVIGDRADNYISSSPFSIPNLENVAIMLSQKGIVSIRMLPPKLNVIGSSAISRSLMKKTGHFIVHHEPTDALVVAASVQEQEKEFIQESDEGDQVIAPSPIYHPAPTYALYIFVETDDQGVGGLKEVGMFQTPEGEVVNCMEQVFLDSPNFVKRKPLIALCTIDAHDENCYAKGHIIVLDLLNAMSGEDSADENPVVFSRIATKEIKGGGVSALQNCQGQIAVAVGQKIFIYKLNKEDGLEATAFTDIAHFYPSSLRTLNSLVLIADAFKGCSIAQTSLNCALPFVEVISKEISRDGSLSCEFLYNGGNISFLLSERRGFLKSLVYKSDSPDSERGERLLNDGEFYVGESVRSFRRFISGTSMGKASAALPHKKISNEFKTQIHGAVGAAVNGKILVAIPLPETVHRRLMTLQNVLSHHLDASTGNGGWAAFRSYKPYMMSTSSTKRVNFTDAALLRRFLNLSHTMQKSLAEEIGTKLELLLENLSMIYHAINII